MEPKVPVSTTGMKKRSTTGAVIKGLGGWADVGFDAKVAVYIKLMNSLLKMMGFVFKMMNSSLKMMQTGALTHLAKSGGASIAGPENPLLLVRYQVLVETDFDAWRKEYILPGAGGFNEYGKPGVTMKSIIFNINPSSLI